MEQFSNNKLEDKIDKIMEAVNEVSGKVQSMDATIREREKSEILRNEVLSQALRMQNQSHNDLKCRVEKLESNQGRVIWLVMALVITAMVGTIIIK